VQPVKKTPPEKIRFHTVVIWFIAFLTLISVSLRTTFLVYEIVTDCRYQKRIKKQKVLWQERKTLIEKHKQSSLKKKAKKTTQLRSVGVSSGKTSSGLFVEVQTLPDYKPKGDDPLPESPIHGPKYLTQTTHNPKKTNIIIILA